jgi:Carboxypeptidase regulatory-like domain
MKNRQIGVSAPLAVALVYVLSAAHSLAQQPNTGQISGHVVDEAGATIKGASVFVRRNIPPEENVRLLTHTDIHGDFKLVLPEGGYDVLVTSAGFASGFETVPVLVGKHKRMQWKLKPLDCSFPGINCDVFQ